VLSGTAAPPTPGLHLTQLLLLLLLKRLQHQQCLAIYYALAVCPRELLLWLLVTKDLSLPLLLLLLLLLMVIVVRPQGPAGLPQTTPSLLLLLLLAVVPLYVLVPQPLHTSAVMLLLPQRPAPVHCC
jgi:hypothetical protein